MSSQNSSSYTRCPFSYGLFIGTTAIVTAIQRRKDELSKQPTLPAIPICEVVFVLGGPGAGKGTQCQLLEERLKGWKHLSAGDLLRQERKSGGELGDLINSKIEAGELVPSSITCKCIEKAMIRAFQQNKTTRFLIDGFPRSHENMKAWEDTMRDHTIKFVLDFECPEEVLVDRLLERGKDSGRSDDNIDVIRKRFKTHQESAVPIIDYFKQHGTPVHQIDSAKGIEQIYANVVTLFS